MIGRLFCLLVFCAAGAIGFGLGSGYLPRKGAKLAAEIHPEKEFAVTEFKSFAIALFAHNDAAWCERTLRSIFSQDYDYFRLIFVDDGSQDNTYEKVQEFVVENNQEHRVILMRNETEMGAIASLYRVAGHCLDREVILALSARDWLAGPRVFSSLNRAFQNPDVWIACGKALSYPSYEFIEPPKWNPKKGYSNYEGFRAFYGALLKQLPLQNTFSKEFSLVPLLELAGGRVKNISEPLLFRNEVLPNTPAAEPLQHFAPLAAFPKSSLRSLQTDILLFSDDRPLQLFAVLESIQRFMTGFNQITVLYRASEKFASAYSQMKESFPDVLFIADGEKLRESSAEYVLLAKEELVVKEVVDLKPLVEMMDKTHADAFLLEPVKASKPMPLSGGIIACSPTENRLGMTLYRKNEVLGLKRHKELDKGLPALAVALAFEEPKTAKLPLDFSEELLGKFYQGLKIDLESVEFEGRPDFVPR